LNKGIIELLKLLLYPLIIFGAFIALVALPDIFAEEHYQWSLRGSDGYIWEYYTVDTEEELQAICGWAAGCTQPQDHKAYVWEKVRHHPSDKPCLTVEEHELMHVLGWWHNDMILFCLKVMTDQLQEQYPTMARSTLEQMAINQQTQHRR